MAEKFVLGKQDLDHLIRGGELRTTNGTCVVLSDIGNDQVQYLAERLGHVPPLVGKIREVHSMVLEQVPRVHFLKDGPLKEDPLKGLSVPGWHE
jgi:hypothetical protein